MTYYPNNPNGQATSANSAPVVIASNQSNLPANILQINSGTIATAATGVMKVGVTDGTGNAIGSTSGALNVNVSSGGSGVSAVDGAAWTAGTSTLTPIGGEYNSTLSTLTSGDQGTLALTNYRGAHVNLRSSSGTEIGTTANPIQVAQSDVIVNATLSSATSLSSGLLTGTSIVTIQVEGTWSGILTPQASLDNSSWTNLSSTGLMNVNTNAYTATIASAVAATGLWQSDIAGFAYFRINMTTYTSGSAVVYMKFSNATGAIGIDNPLPPGTNALGSVGSSSSTGSAIPSAAFLEGAQAITALPTAASNGNLVGISSDKFGRLIVVPQGMRNIQAMQYTSSISTGGTTVVTAAGSGIYADIESIVFVNSSGTATSVTLSDGTNSYAFYVPAGDMRGASYQAPLAATTANVAWTATAGTTVTSLAATVQYVKNQ